MAKNKATKANSKNQETNPTNMDQKAYQTLIVSCHRFLESHLSKAGIKFQSIELLKNLANAVDAAVRAQPISQENRPAYNLAGDVLCAAFIAHRENRLEEAQAYMELAFQSPDCEGLMESLAQLNMQSEGSTFDTDLQAETDQSESDGDKRGLFQATMPSMHQNIDDVMQDVKDKTGGPQVDSDENNGGENSVENDREDNRPQVAKAGAKTRKSAPREMRNRLQHVNKIRQQMKKKAADSPLSLRLASQFEKGDGEGIDEGQNKENQAALQAIANKMSVFGDDTGREIAKNFMAEVSAGKAAAD